jgi:hypothetical protein
MNNRNLVAVFSLLIVLAGGTYVLIQKNMDKSDQNIDVTEISPGELPETYPGGQRDNNDSLGLRDITLQLISGLNEIVDNKGTVEDIIDLAEELETVLNSTLADIELDENQVDMVEQLNAQLDFVRELAEGGTSAVQILEQIKPQKRPN